MKKTITPQEFSKDFENFFGEPVNEDNGSLIEASIETYGAAKVYDAANRAMVGDRNALPSVGLSATRLSTTLRIQSMAYEGLSESAKRADYADATAQLNRLCPACRQANFHFIRVPLVLRSHGD